MVPKNGKIAKKWYQLCVNAHIFGTNNVVGPRYGVLRLNIASFGVALRRRLLQALFPLQSGFHNGFQVVVLWLPL